MYLHQKENKIKTFVYCKHFCIFEFQMKNTRKGKGFEDFFFYLRKIESLLFP
jgi:hypothetical protein